MRSLIVQIPQPCHERWDDMQPNEQGRFCAGCQKTVIDYTAFSDKELLSLLAQPSETSCGRFRNEQLNRPLTASKPVNTSIWRQWIGLLSMSLFGWQTTQAQQNQANRSLTPQTSVRPVYSVTSLPIRTSVSPEQKSVITGRVMVRDSSGTLSPVAEAYLYIERSGEKGQAQTDSMGVYTLLFPTRSLTSQLTVYAQISGRLFGKITFDASTSDTSVVLNDIILTEPMPRKAITGGGMVLVHTPSTWQKLKRKLFHWRPKKSTES